MPLITKLAMLQICDAEVADKILAMIDLRLDPCLASDRADAWNRQCHTYPGYDDLVMQAADELLETCGVEGWAIDPDDPSCGGVSYCNTGDQYALTLALVNGEFTIASWTDLKEANA